MKKHSHAMRDWIRCLAVGTFLLGGVLHVSGQAIGFGKPSTISIPSHFPFALRTPDQLAGEADAKMLQAALALAPGHDAATQAAAVETYLDNLPATAWGPALRLNLGAHYASRCQYTLALQHWEAAWEATKDYKNGPGKELADYALAHWTRLLAALGRIEQLERIFAETSGRELDGGPLQQILLHTRETWILMKKNPASAYCGLIALKNTARALYGDKFDESALMAYRTPQTTYSLRALKDVSQKFGFNLVPAERKEGSQIVVPSVVHWKQNHFAAIVAGDGQGFRVMDTVYRHEVIVTADEINREASGNFLVPSGLLPAGWEVLGDDRAEMVMGRSNPVNMNDAPDFGCPDPTGCTCLPGMNGPSSRQGSGGGGGCGSGGCGPISLMIGGASSRMGVSPGGMPQWRVSEPFINLWIEDEPLAYQPALGDPLSFRLEYKQRDENLSADARLFGFGKSWNASWLSYVYYKADRRYDNRYVVLPGGGELNFPRDSTNYQSNSKLIAGYDTNNNNAITNFTLTFPDGAQLVYDFIRTDETGDWMYAMLTQRIDANGFVTRFNYQTYDPATQIVRLASVSDADGRTNTLTYVVSTPNETNNLVSTITDPYGRSVSLSYNANAQLTNITDVGGLQSGLMYNSYGWPTNLTIPYGQTGFAFEQTTNTDGPTYRAVIANEPENTRQIYVLYLHCNTNLNGTPWMSSQAPAAQTPSGTPMDGTLDSSTYDQRNTFYWGRTQSRQRPASIASFTIADFTYARMRHWLTSEDGEHPVVTETLSLERDPRPDDNVSEGRLTWYNYADKTSSERVGTQIQPALIARVLPDGTTWYEYYVRNEFGLATNIVSTYTLSTGGIGTRTNFFVYDANNGIDLIETRGPAYELLTSYTYNSRHQVLTKIDYASDNVSYTNTWTYDASYRVDTQRNPAGLVSAYAYHPNNGLSDHNTYKLAKVVEQTIGGTPIRTNSYTWQNGAVRTHTDPRGLTVTKTFDALGRLTQVDYPDATSIQHSYSLPSGYGFNTSGSDIPILDLAGVRDRLGNWTRYGYDRLRRVVSETDRRTNTTGFEYCDCGSPSVVSNALHQNTLYFYDNLGRKTDVYDADTNATHFEYNASGQLVRVSDPVGSRTNYYNNQGLLLAVSNAFGQVLRHEYDVHDRVVGTTDANGVTATQTYDRMGRLLTRAFPDNGVERYGYVFGGVAAFTNQVGDMVRYDYDITGAMTNEVRVGVATNRYAYRPSGDLWQLTDGNGSVTTWAYDSEGQVTGKTNTLNQAMFVYLYDANGNLTNRWNSRGNTGYRYDSMGNLLEIRYPVMTNASLAYDALNRLTNQVDAAGTTRYTFTAGGLPATEDGPWSSDTVTRAYNGGRLRSGLSVQLSGGGAWSQSLAYDTAWRLSTLTSSEGQYTYSYQGAGTLKKRIVLPNGACVTNAYDTVARLTDTWLLTSGGYVSNYSGYTYNTAHRRATQARSDASYVTYSYDGDGRLYRALGSGGLSTENLGYGYDASGNMVQRTNGAAVTTYTVNSLNQLTNGYYYDGNGNLTNTNTGAGSTTYYYDDEDRLVQIDNPGAYRTMFKYDVQGRLRVRDEYGWSGATWTQSDSVRYLYDGLRVVQTRAWNETVSYTRGPDLSGAWEGAGGIGGMLARTVSGVPAYYHADGNGNITALMNTSQALVAKYKYDPYGRMLSSSGTLSGANVFRFSSKENIYNANLYHYGYRFYNPTLQRWPNRDPLQENDGPNLYTFVHNNPVNSVDTDGRSDYNRPAASISMPSGGMPVAVYGPPSPEPSVNRGNSLSMDGVHTGLDAAGLIDPSPLSDGANALAYALEGDLDNFGISFASAMLPYFGDAAKAGKYKKIFCDGGLKGSMQRKNLESLKNQLKNQLQGKQREQFKRYIERQKVGEQYSTTDQIYEAFDYAKQFTP